MSSVNRPVCGLRQAQAPEGEGRGKKNPCRFRMIEAIRPPEIYSSDQKGGEKKGGGVPNVLGQRRLPGVPLASP